MTRRPRAPPLAKARAAPAALPSLLPPGRGAGGDDPPSPARAPARDPLPTSPLKGGRNADGADRTLRHRRRWTNGRIAAVFSPPPWKG